MTRRETGGLGMRGSTTHTSARAAGRESSSSARHRRGVTVRDDRVDSEVDDEARTVVVRSWLSRGSPDERRHQHLRGAVDGQGAEPCRRSDRLVQRFRHAVPAASMPRPLPKKIPTDEGP